MDVSLIIPTDKPLCFLPQAIASCPNSACQTEIMSNFQSPKRVFLGHLYQRLRFCQTELIRCAQLYLAYVEAVQKGKGYG